MATRGANMAIIGNEDHKQRVNLSSLARSAIEIDLNMFDEGGSLSGFLNRIITSFRDTAKASVDLVVEERLQQLILKNYPPEIAKRLAEDYRQELIQETQGYPAGDSLMFRLNNHNFTMLYEDRAESNAYSAPSKYLKALLEEYARLSPSERERVYYAAVIRQQIEPALEAGHLLEIRMSGKRFILRPHGLIADPFNSHLYLVGMARQEDKLTEQESIASFRVSRLEQVKQKKQNGKLTIEEKRAVEKQLQQLGVQYLVGTRDHIKVRLTPTGQREFLQRSYMRPVLEEVQGDVYSFNCSPRQARNYFFSFGKNVEILEPGSLRREFMKNYRDAAKI